MSFSDKDYVMKFYRYLLFCFIGLSILMAPRIADEFYRYFFFWFIGFFVAMVFLLVGQMPIEIFYLLNFAGIIMSILCWLTEGIICLVPALICIIIIIIATQRNTIFDAISNMRYAISYNLSRLAGSIRERLSPKLKLSKIANAIKKLGARNPKVRLKALKYLSEIGHCQVTPPDHIPDWLNHHPNKSLISMAEDLKNIIMLWDNWQKSNNNYNYDNLVCKYLIEVLFMEQDVDSVKEIFKNELDNYGKNVETRTEKIFVRTERIDEVYMGDMNEPADDVYVNVIDETWRVTGDSGRYRSFERDVYDYIDVKIPSPLKGQEGSHLPDKGT